MPSQPLELDWYSTSPDSAVTVLTPSESGHETHAANLASFANFDRRAIVELGGLFIIAKEEIGAHTFACC